MRSKSDEKKMVWSGYGHKALKIVRTKFRGRLVRMRSPVRIWVAAPKILENSGFRGFFVAKIHFFVWVKMLVSGLTHTVTYVGTSFRSLASP